jgi:hypothetical protein
MAGTSSGGTGSKRRRPPAAVNNLSAVKGWKRCAVGLPPSFPRPSRQRYNSVMCRAALFTLLAASVLIAPMWAQRGGGGHAGGGHVSGGHSAGVSGHSGFGGHHGGGRFGSRRFPGDRGAWNNYGYGGDYPYFLPDDWYDGPDSYDGQDSGAPVDSAPLPVAMQRVREERPPRPLPPAQVIEIPGTSSAVAKALPPTVFILTSGERLESDRFVLTATSLSVNVHRSLRTIPLDMLDIDATLAANRDRGIDLRIPSDRNEISLRF